MTWRFKGVERSLRGGQVPLRKPLEPAAFGLQLFPGARGSVWELRADMRLASVAATQLLAAWQRAVLVLREVLQFTVAEVAGQLGATTAAVNSAFKRARAALDEACGVEEVPEPDDPEAGGVLRRLVQAFEAADVSALASTSCARRTTPVSPPGSARCPTNFPSSARPPRTVLTSSDSRSSDFATALMSPRLELTFPCGEGQASA
ncbi:hypothetical protein OHT57_02305 [Streptomyces sp. NBC_00285]|uniref:sigma factor-like helix-turn-helix DNA-binding protein n=1 Tax=Streptomyces sp. NBC_00285 TaxID=2975700 RepID=UPI002E2B5A50|nr:sigma factor-like helix-turn-helix DNA-binding protein [Streptomyces sp. NBC_00285]